MAPILARFGLTRDDAKWVWFKLVGFATLILANVGNLQGWLAYVGIDVGELTIHRISAAAAVILLIGGHYSGSNLPAAPINWKK